MRSTLIRTVDGMGRARRWKLKHRMQHCLKLRTAVLLALVRRMRFYKSFRICSVPSHPRETFNSNRNKQRAKTNGVPKLHPFPNFGAEKIEWPIVIASGMNFRSSFKIIILNEMLFAVRSRSKIAVFRCQKMKKKKNTNWKGFSRHFRSVKSPWKCPRKKTRLRPFGIFQMSFCQWSVRCEIITLS